MNSWMWNVTEAGMKASPLASGWMERGCHSLPRSKFEDRDEGWMGGLQSYVSHTLD